MVLGVMAWVATLLLAAHLSAAGPDGQLEEPMLGKLAVTPLSALALSPHLLWAGLFHFSWQHLGYNLALFAVAFPLATRGRGPWAPLTTLVAAGGIALAVVLALPALVIQPLAGLGIAYAAEALDQRLVGASIAVFAVAGAALANLPRRVAMPLAAAGVVAELVAAAVGTRPFVFAFHLAGLAFGYVSRVLVVFARERTASVFMRPDAHSSSRLRRAFSGRSGQSTHFGSASQQASRRSRGASGGQDMLVLQAQPRPSASAMLLEDEPAARGLRARNVADAVDDRVEV